MPRRRPADQGPSGRGPLRVLWLIKGLGLGGAEKLLVSLAKAHDPDVVDLSCAYLLPRQNLLVPDLVAAGVPVECLTGRDDLGHHGQDLDLRWALALRRRLRARPVDVLHLHLRYPAVIGRLVAYSLPPSIRPRLVFTEHNVWGEDILVSRLCNRLTIGLDDADLAVSNLVRDSLPPGLRERVHEVVHGITVGEAARAREHRDAVRRELGVGPDEIVVGTVANYRTQKAYDVLLAAASRVVGRNNNVRFVAVGHGPLAAEIEQTHRQLGLGDRFVLLGAREDAMRLLSGFDVFVLASRFEGFPVAIMEATAMGLPVVATAVGGIPDAIRDGVEGLVVPVDQPDLLAEAVLTLATDSELRRRMAAASLERSRDYDITEATRRIEQIYREVVDDGRSWATDESSRWQRARQRLPH